MFPSILCAEHKADNENMKSPMEKLTCCPVSLTQGIWVWLGIYGCECGYVSVLCWGGGVQELGSVMLIMCEALHRLCFEIVFTVMMIP